MTVLRRFARFWLDFLVGDDWRLTLGSAVALGVTAVLAGAGVVAWWITPAIVVAVLVATVARTRPRCPR
jgi:hypothetical protein